MANYKLGVEVIGAHDLMPKDGDGSASSCVELHFDGQKCRTSVKEKDINPVWNEQFYFQISDPFNLPNLFLEASIYNVNKDSHAKSFLGKVRISGTSFVPNCDSVVMHYPLEKRGLFSRVRGELGLKVFITDDPSIKASNLIPAMDPLSNLHSNPNSVPVVRELKSEARQNFHSIQKETHDHSHQHNHHHPSVNTFTDPPPVPPIHMGPGQVRYSADPMRPEQVPVPTRMVRMYSSVSSQQPPEYALKETNPFLGGGQIVGGRVIRSDKPSSTYDLVEQMQYLFVRVVKAKELPSMDVTGSLDPFVEVRVGNYRGTTRHFEKKQNPEWNEVFAFSRERTQTSVLEVVVKDKDLIKDDFVGIVRFDLSDVPTRVPPDSPLAPEWYRLVDKKGEKAKGELMLAVWIGTQADEAFPDAWHSDAAVNSDSAINGTLIRSKVYHAPRLWYVRVNVIEAQDIIVHDKTRFPDVYVRAQIGHQVMRTRPCQARPNPFWNEDLMFVASEPFEDHLVISLEDRVGPNKDEIVGRVMIPLMSIERRADDRIVHGRWYNLEKAVLVDVDQLKKEKFATRLHIRVCLDGGYHVLDESTHYSSDLRPTAKQLWKPSIGLLELGVLGAEGLHPMKTREGKGTSDTYCVAKYGHKWVRTRTILNSLCPKFNEQYTWEVFDPATVLTIGVFDNNQFGEKNKEGNGNGNNNHNHNDRDAKVGKVRIRLSTLETGRVYTHRYPLLVLHPSGVKKMGELHLAIRFTSTSLVNMFYQYSRPLLPKMHYVRPLTVMQLEHLRHQAVQIVAARLGRMEPPLRREVVEYMNDVDSHLWSMRRSKANFFRLMTVFSGAFAVGRWFSEVCTWRNPITSVLVHILFLMLVIFPELILPTIFLYMFLIGIWNYRYRPRYPPHMNTKISHAEGISPDELDEEFDTFPSSKSVEVVRMRYDRLRSVAGRIQTVVGDIATQGERLQALLSWRDPRATAIFIVFCLVAAVGLYVTPLQVLVAVSGFYVMRHPRFRHRLPGPPVNFFRRLPARTDSLL